MDLFVIFSVASRSLPTDMHPLSKRFMDALGHHCGLTDEANISDCCYLREFEGGGKDAVLPGLPDNVIRWAGDAGTPAAGAN